MTLWQRFKTWLDRPLFVIACIVLLGLVVRHFFVTPMMAQPDTSRRHIDTQMLFASKLPDLQGKTQALSQYRGKILIVNFWATWCPPCREEMPELSAFHQKYQAKNVVVLGLAIDDLDKVQAFSKSAPVSYPLFADNDLAMTLSQNLGNDRGVLPYTVLIRPDGTIAEVFFGQINEAVLEQSVTPILGVSQQ